MVPLSTLMQIARSPHDLQWDEWIASPHVRQQRYVLAPARSRLLPFSLPVRQDYIPFLEMDFRYLYKPNYDRDIQQALHSSQLILSLADVQWRTGRPFRMEYNEYRARQSMESVMRQFGVESPPRGGVFAWSYRGVGMVELADGVTVFVTCNQVWPCDTTSAFSTVNV